MSRNVAIGVDGHPARDLAPVSRAAELLAPVLVLVTLELGLVLRVLTEGSGAAAGLIVAAAGLDLYARGLGVRAAGRDRPAAVLCGLVGSPAVLAHALVARTGRLVPRPGAVAGSLVPVVLVVGLWAAAAG